MSNKIAETRYKNIINRNAMASSKLDKKEFINWYGDDCKDRQCEYCLIKESEIKTLISQGKIYTKRLTTRGRTMEVDRKDPKGHYEIKNLIMSCYWCNNAKTDEFSYDETMQKKGKSYAIWKNRLKSTVNIPTLKNEESLRCDWDKPKGIVLALPWGINSNSQSKTLSNNKDWATIVNIIDKILKNFESEDFKIYLVYKETSTYSNAIKNAMTEVSKQLRIEFEELNINQRIVFVPIPHLDSIWINGAMPLKINNEEKVLKAVYSPSYYNNSCLKDCKPGYRKYAYYEHVSALEIAESLDLQIRYISKGGGGYWYECLESENCKNKCDENYEIKNEDTPIILDNNDFVHNGKIGFINQRVLEENCVTCDEKDDFLEKFMKYTNLKKICVLKTNIANADDCEKEKSKQYGFLSDKIRFLDEKTLLIKDCFKKHDLQECCKVIENFCDNEKININEEDFDLDYLRVGNLILNNKEIKIKDKTIEIIETDDNLFSISWVF